MLNYTNETKNEETNLFIHNKTFKQNINVYITINNNLLLIWLSKCNKDEKKSAVIIFLIFSRKRKMKENAFTNSFKYDI